MRRYTFAIAFLLFVFGLVAEAVVEGKSSAFDRSIILAFRDHTNPSAPIGSVLMALLQQGGQVEPPGPV